MLRCSHLLAVAVVSTSLGCLDLPSPGADAGPDDDAGQQDDAGPDDGDDAGVTACTVVPGPWSAPDFAANAAEALALRGQLDQLTGAPTMRGAELGDVPVDEVADLQALLDAGEKTLTSVVHAGFAPLLAGALSEFVEAVTAGPQDLIDDATQWVPGAEGGVFGGRAFNEGGIELRQIVDKGVFAGGGFYNYAASLTAGEITPATIDGIVAAWGANATLDPADAAAPLADGANYTHAMGSFAEAKLSLERAKAFAADAECTAERDAAILAFFRTWEKSMFARTVFYANVAATEAAGAADDEAFVGALHELAEGLGLAVGFHGLPNPASGPLAAGAKLVADAQIAQLAAELGLDVTDLGASTTGDDVVETNFATPVSAVEVLLGTALGVEAAEVDSWAAPTEG